MLMSPSHRYEGLLKDLLTHWWAFLLWSCSNLRQGFFFFFWVNCRSPLNKFLLSEESMFSKKEIILILIETSSAAFPSLTKSITPEISPHGLVPANSKVSKILHGHAGMYSMNNEVLLTFAADELTSKREVSAFNSQLWHKATHESAGTLGKPLLSASSIPSLQVVT